MARSPAHELRPGSLPGGYVLVVRGPGGRPRVERFEDVTTYRMRLLALEPSRDAGLSIDDIAALLDN